MSPASLTNPTKNGVKIGTKNRYDFFSATLPIAAISTKPKLRILNQAIDKAQKETVDGLFQFSDALFVATIENIAIKTEKNKAYSLIYHFTNESIITLYKTN